MSVNTVQPLIERVRKIYDHGISIAAGLIIGFDSDKPRSDLPVIRRIEENGIALSMVGLLTALPNTQLTRRRHSWTECSIRLGESRFATST